MKRLINILILLFLTTFTFAQAETRVIDSLESVMAKQEGREKVETMMELSKAFSDYSFDDCIDWGEKAIKESKSKGYTDLEADANYVLGSQYGNHADIDLSYDYLKKAYDMHTSIGDETKAFEDIWRQAYFEHVYGNVDTALIMYEKALVLAVQRKDTLGIAKVNGNKAVLYYLKQEYSEAVNAFEIARKNYCMLGDSVMVTRMDANLASVYMESGRMVESQRLFYEVIPKLEAYEDYEWLLMVYKNYGQFFVKNTFNYDSAYYYYQKDYLLLAFLEENGILVPVSNKVDILVEKGNVHSFLRQYTEALNEYNEAYELAKKNSYHSGQMLACLGLANVYSQDRQPLLSQFYFEQYFELESSSGITLAHSVMRFPLIVNYARLGRFVEMESELSKIEDEFNGLKRENDDLYEQNCELLQTNDNLIIQSDSQNDQIQTLQTQRNQYRLAFFGLLAIALFALALLIAYKIVRKKRAKV